MASLQTARSFLFAPGSEERKLVRALESDADAVVADLEEAGYISRERVGRRNRYEFHPEAPMRHPQLGHALLRDIHMGDLVAPLMAPGSPNGAHGAGSTSKAPDRNA